MIYNRPESWIKKKVLIISFTIDGTSYQAEEGMTWGQWVYSDYNDSGFYIKNGYLRNYGDDAYVGYENGTRLNESDLISKNVNLVEIILFTIVDIEYTAYSNMTWSEWCDSSFNVDGFYVDGSLVSDGERYVLNVTSTDIIEERVYSLI